MSEALYMPLDSILKDPSQALAAMDTTDMIAPTARSGKLADLNVSVAEINPDMSSPDIDELTIRSPAPRIEANRYMQPIRPCSPAGSVRSSGGGYARRVKRRVRWSSGFRSGHRSEVSKELTVQAESEFLGLVELMAGISRRSTSLREVWTKIISERESMYSEMDRMSEKFEEYEEIIECHEKEKNGHNHEHEERKKELIKIRLELTASLNLSAELKRKLTDRDYELVKCRGEISEYQDNYKYLKEEHESTKTLYEETRLLLVASEDRCHHAEEDSKKHHSELKQVRHTLTELQSSHFELKSKYEHSSKELKQLKIINETLRKEKHEWMHEKGELDECLRKCRHQHEEVKRKVKELTESYEKKEIEVREFRETITKIKYEKEELHKKVKDLRRELDEEHCKWEDAEDRCGKWKLKWEHSERELVHIREEISRLETETSEFQETITKKTEEYKLVVIERDEYIEKYHDKCKEAEDCHRSVLVLREEVHRHESTIKQKTEEIHIQSERIERIECECIEYRTKCQDLEAKIIQKASLIASLKVDIETINKECSRLRESYHECERRYVEVCESMTEYHEGHSGYEHDISELRTMLREVREQKEKAISMRNSADRERDEAIVKYEEKCREVEKLREHDSHHHHPPRNGGHYYRRSGSRFEEGRRYISSSTNNVLDEEYDTGSVMNGGIAQSIA